MDFYQLPNGEVAGFDDPSDAPAGAAPITTEQFAQVATTPVLTLAQAQASQCAQIDAAYYAAIQQNVTFKTAAGVTKAFQADADSQTLVMQAAQGYGLAGETPSGFYWVAADDTQVTPFVLTDLQGLYQAILAQGWASFQKRQTLKAQINAASTVAAAQAIVWS